MKPWIHAELSAKKFGGRAEDYMPIHQLKCSFGEDPSIMFVVVQDGELVATAQVKLDNYPTIHSVYVEEKHRRCGIGTALIEAATEYVRSEGRDTISLFVDTKNQDAKRLYESLGFSIWFVTEGDEYYMAKRIS